MCNYLHPNSKPIPLSGIGYKIVNSLGGPVFNSVLRPYPIGKWIKWNTDANSSMGFCFFLNYEVAVKCHKALKVYGKYYQQSRIVKIEYKQGLGKHAENNIILEKLFCIALCKSFKILPELDK